MNWRVYLLCVTLTAFASAPNFAQPGKPSVAREPAWITRNAIDYKNSSLDKDATDGYIDISYERQVSLADKSEYTRRSKKIISQSGVQNGSQISVSFDPSFEQLIFHSIIIIRNGEVLNRLRLSDIQTLHQEADLSNFIYNGSLDATLVLNDVRQGDIIEYSYTRKGFNPIFKNKYIAELGLEFSFPLYEIYYKIIVPPGRKINFKNLNTTIQPVANSVSGQQVYEWNKKNSTPLPLQDYTPSWYDPFAQVLVSEYSSWKEVNDWAMELFPVKKELSAALQKKIGEIEKTNTGDEGKIKAALRFVEDDIRYMGFEMGENSHRPADPSKVFAQRFGDCKEKSYLLCCMLRAMHIDASPVLINTTSKKNLHELLPAPTDFDHCTVRVKLNSIYYWFDPTIAYQRGPIKNIFYPDYQAGLVVADSTSDLTDIAFRNTGGEYVKEHFRVRTMSGAGTLMVTTTFTGGAADDARDNMNSESISETMTSYQKFYGAYYEDIKADSLNYKDDDSTGAFVITEYYSLPDFWTKNKTGGKKFSISSFVVNSILRRPKDKKRKMPFSLSFPAKYKEEITVELPAEWKVTESETHLKNNCFSYNSKFYCNYKEVHLNIDYENLKGHVTPEESIAYFKDLAVFDDNGDFVLTSGKNESESAHSDNSNTSGNNIISIIVIMVLLTGAVIWWTRR